MKKLTIGVIGAGRIGKVHAENIAYRMSEANIKTIADVNLAEAEKLAKKLNIPVATDNYSDILNDGEIDAVIICSPTNTHVQHIIESARAGKHIFCEKPIDLNLNVIHNALNVVEECNVKLMVGFNRRFDPNFRKIHDMVKSNKIGKPHIIKITSRDPAPPPAEYISVSGGMFLDMTIHDFDMARYVVGSEVEEVFVTAGVLIDDKIGEAGDVDTAIISLKFENGAMGVIDNSRKAVYGYDQRVVMFGSKGMIKVSNNKKENHKYFDGNGEHSSLPLNFFMDRYTESYYQEVQLFIAAIVNDTEPPVTGEDGLKAVMIALAAKQSVAENRPIKI